MAVVAGMVVAGTEDGAAPAGASMGPLTSMAPDLITAVATKRAGFLRLMDYAGGECGSAVNTDIHRKRKRRWITVVRACLPVVKAILLPNHGGICSGQQRQTFAAHGWDAATRH